jgi:3-hydroxyacyl-CoA dehydrogenase
MTDEQILKGLKDKLEKLKREKAQAEGERNAILATIKKDFDVGNIDEAYALLEKMSADIEIKTEQRTELLKEAQDRLANYK